MSEQGIPENYPRCRFCGQPMGDGDFILEEAKLPYEVTSPGLLGVCDACWILILAIIEDNLPDLLRKVMDKAEKPLRERLSCFDYQNWEKYVKKKPEENP